ncbi:MAG: outer membrane protein assembly factor BamA, partial [Myxococcota bacterium]
LLEIRVEGTGRIEPDAIRAALHIHPGDPIAGMDLGAEIRRIYALGFFRDVQALSEEAPGGRVVTFVVEENPVIREIAISGNHDIGPDEIREQLTLTVGSTIDYPLLVENRARLQAFYATRGYYLSTVDFKIEPFSEGAVSVDFVIDEGRKLRLVEVDFEGNHFFSDKELRAVMQTRPWTWKSWVSHYWDTSGVYAEPIFFQDLDRIRRKYADAGFIRARATDPEVTHDERGLHVRVQIEEGDQFRVGKVDVVGDETMDREELMGLVSMKPGALFRRSDLTGDVETLEGHYKDRGFYFAKVSAQTDVDPETRVIDCAFEVEKGDLYFVDRIDVRGNRTTRDNVVRRELSVAEGELYAANALERSRARVQRLGFFEEVQLKAKPTDRPGRVAVDVDVVERPTGSFSFGAGVGSTDGFLLNAGLQKQNLFGRGYGATLNANVGGQTKRFFLRFSNPYAFGTSANYGVTLSRTDIQFNDFSQKITGFDWTFGYPLDEGETRAFAGYSFTSRETTGLDVQASSLLQREEAQSQNVSSLFQLSFRHDVRDDPQFPKRGHQYGGSIEWAGFGGVNRFLRAETGGTWYFPLHGWLPFESTFVVNARAGWVVPFNSLSDFDLPDCGGDPSDSNTCVGDVNHLNSINAGSVAALSDIDSDLKLPLTERYFLGGLGQFQVRGFKQRSLGPRRAILVPAEQPPGSGQRFFTASCPNAVADLSNCNSIDDKDIKDFQDLNLTDVIGGNKFALVNTELRFPVSEALGLEGLVFFDAGNAFAENETINPVDFRFGTGIGAQWFSPFGPILVQLGIPLDRLEDEDAKVFEFSFGGSRY